MDPSVRTPWTIFTSEIQRASAKDLSSAFGQSVQDTRLILYQRWWEHSLSTTLSVDDPVFPWGQHRFWLAGCCSQRVTRALKKWPQLRQKNEDPPFFSLFTGQPELGRALYLVTRKASRALEMYDRGAHSTDLCKRGMSEPTPREHDEEAPLACHICTKTGRLIRSANPNAFFEHWKILSIKKTAASVCEQQGKTWRNNVQ